MTPEPPAHGPTDAPAPGSHGSKAARQVTVRTADGVELALHHFPARGPRRAVCLCTHAMMTDSRYFSRGSQAGFAGHLARRGIETYVLDFRGHGASRPRLSRRHAHWCFDDYVVHDLPAAVAAVCRLSDSAPSDMIYVGHSLGGVAALAALGTGTIPGFRALTLWAVSLWLPGPRGSRRRRAAAALYDLSARPLGRAPIRALGLGNNDEPRGYVSQLATWARTGLWRSRDGVDYLASLATIEVPTWAVCGAGDRLCSFQDAEVMRKRIRHSAPLRRVGVGFGDPLDCDHFTLFTREEMAPLWDEMIDVALPRSSR